jgi:hypothetical protein
MTFMPPLLDPAQAHTTVINIMKVGTGPGQWAKPLVR